MVSMELMTNAQAQKEVMVEETDLRVQMEILETLVLVETHLEMLMEILERVVQLEVKLYISNLSFLI